MKKVLLLSLILIAGFGGVFILSITLETIKPKPDETRADDDLYFSARQLSAAGRDFRGLIADWYWINSLQYMGNKLVNNQGNVNINDLKPLNPRLLYPMLDTAATLDPQFISVYSYGANVLPAIDNGQAIALLKKGIAANPENWRLYHNLGYIYWQMKDYKNAAEYYSAGSTKADAPVWMKQMSATMQAQGGSREFALQIYKQMSETAEDEQTKTFAELRYRQIIALEELDSIRSALQIFRQINNRCPQTWREALPYLMKSVPPYGDALKRNQNDEMLDPSGTPYLLINENGSCDARLTPDSKIPQPEM